MVVIVSRRKEGRELFVGNYPTRDKALEVVQSTVKLNAYSPATNVEHVEFTSGTFYLRELEESEAPAPTTTDYVINSHSDWNKTYTVTVEDGSQKPIKCTCPDHEYRQNFCKHMKQVTQFGTKSLMLAKKTPPAPVPDLDLRYYLVRSESSWTKAYTVTVDNTKGLAVACTCPSFEHRKEPCKHMLRKLVW